jgi:hypothetical protein
MKQMLISAKVEELAIPTEQLEEMHAPALRDIYHYLVGNAVVRI